jgi:hypothetical protein
MQAYVETFHTSILSHTACGNVSLTLKRVFVCAVLTVTVVTQEVPNVDPGHDVVVVWKNLPLFEENSSPLHSH